MAIQRNLTTSPFRTTAGSYEAPVEGIVDYGAFDRGLEKGLAPGLAFAEEKKKKEEEADKIKLDVSTKAFTGVNKNEMTGDVDLKTNDLFEVNAVEAMSRFRPQYIEAVKKGDVQTQNKILRSIGDAKKSYSNLAEYVKNVGDPQTFDGKVSNTRFIDENGKEIYYDAKKFTYTNNNNPQNIRQGVKVNKNGIAKQGFYVKYGDRQVFLNTQDMDQAYRDSHFEIKDNLQADIGDSTRKGGTAELFTREPQYNTDKDSTVTITLADGSQVQTSDGDSTKYIRQQFYDKAKSSATIFAENKYQTTSDPTNESAWQQLLDDKTFVSHLGTETITDENGNESVVPIKISADDRNNNSYDDEEKIDLLRDYAAERWKISVADKGYITGDNGRALERNTVAYNATQSETTKPIEEEDIGDNTVIGFMENIFSRFNAASSGASSVLKDSPIYEEGKKGGILEGDAAQNTLTLLRGRKFDGKKIVDVKYTKVGNKKDKEGNITGPDLRLQVFTQTGDDEIPQMSLVNISDAGSRREFLEDIARSKFGEGTAISREIAEAYTNIQTTRSEVQGVFGIYSDRLRKTLETGQWDNNIPAKYKAAFDAVMDRRAEEDFENN